MEDDTEEDWWQVNRYMKYMYACSADFNGTAFRKIKK